jgi:hypothetical protein
MNHGQPAARAKSSEGGGFAAAHLRARRAGYGAAPPAPRVLHIALRATALRAAPDPDHCGPWDQEQRAGPGLPHPARGTQTRRGGARKPHLNAKEQTNWCPVLRKRKITRTAARPRKRQASPEAEPSTISWT